MSKLVKALYSLLVAAMIFAPASALAHGGTKQTTEDAVVQLYQEPLSPLVGETVRADFIFSDNYDSRLKDMPVKLTLIDTYQGNEKLDKVVLTKDLKTDANGIISFTYQFPKPDYYDIDLEFKVNDKTQDTGFLVQSRDPNVRQSALPYGLAALAGIAVALAFSKFKKRTA